MTADRVNEPLRLQHVLCTQRVRNAMIWHTLLLLI